MIKCFKNNCAGSSLTTRVLEIVFGTGYVNNKVCSFQHEKSFKREDYCIKILRTIHLYDLNERARKQDREAPVRKLFFSIPRCMQQPPRHRGKDFSTNINDIIQNDIKNFFIKYV